MSMRKFINLVEGMRPIEDDDGDDSRFDHLPSSATIQQARAQITALAQEVYDGWDETDIDTYAGGGVCHLIADQISSLLNGAGIPTATQCSNYEQHVYCIAQCSDGIWEVDVPYHIYERGGGFSWSKIPGVVFEVSDVVVHKLDGNPARMGEYVEEWEED